MYINNCLLPLTVLHIKNLCFYTFILSTIEIIIRLYIFDTAAAAAKIILFTYVYILFGRCSLTGFGTNSPCKQYAVLLVNNAKWEIRSDQGFQRYTVHNGIPVYHYTGIPFIKAGLPVMLYVK